jgi:hypothetical protein
VGNEKILAAKTGIRLELKEYVSNFRIIDIDHVIDNHMRPQDFLTTHVVQPRSKAESELRIWLSAASSRDITARFKNLFQPKIWMVTGLYLLEDVKVVRATNKNPSASVGIDALTVGALSGVPIGGSISVKPNHELMKVEFATKQRLVWAAQFQRLDVKYLKLEAGQKELTLPCTLQLNPEILSVGSVLRSAPRESLYASLQLLDGEESLENVEEPEEDSEYSHALKEAIEGLEELLS